MLGFHRRTRSLIPVKELGKYDKVPMQEEEQMMPLEVEEEESFNYTGGEERGRRRQLLLVYLVFLAEAYVGPLRQLAMPWWELWEDMKLTLLV
jgi:hypothetical protein